MFGIFGQKKSSRPSRRKAPRPHDKDAEALATLEKFVIEEIEVKAVPDRLTAGQRRARRSTWRPVLRRLATHVGLWLMLVLAALFSRSLWPVDETRFAAMAWELWNHQQWLLPTVNGAVVPAAPLYSWLTVMGWKFLGPLEWWPRVLPALFGLTSLYLLARIARRLWPEEELIRQYAPAMALGTLFFAAFISFAVPMLLLLFFVLLGWSALLMMWRTRDARAWMLFALALGGGLLAHGPVAIIYLLAPALFAPVWAKAPTRPRWGEWYRDVFKAFVVGAAILAAWLVPATLKAGSGFALAFVKNVITPQLGAFTPPGHYVWWYLFLVPFVFLPWFVWPLPWLRLFRIRREPTDPGVAFCMTAMVVPILFLSLFALKQPAYLLPTVPAGVLMIAYLLLKDDLLTVDQDRAFAGMTFPLILIGCGLAILPKLPRVDFLSPKLWELSPFVGVAVVLVGIALAFLPLHQIRQRVQNLATLGVTSVVIAWLTLGSQFDPLQRPNETAAFIATLERQQRPVAIVAPYDGEYQYPGQLREPIQVLMPSDIDQWIAWHPQGVVLADAQQWEPRHAAVVKPIFQHAGFDSNVKAWEASAIGAATPGAGSGEAHRQ